FGERLHDSGLLSVPSRRSSDLAGPCSLEPLAAETWQGLARARLRSQIVMDTPAGPAVTHLQFTFTQFDDLPYLLVDVVVDYADTDRKSTRLNSSHVTMSYAVFC